MKWGWFVGENPKAGRKKLKLYKHALTVFMLTLGVLSLLAFIKIGLENRAMEKPHSASITTTVVKAVAS